jgi:hypothetical protein
VSGEGASGLMGHWDRAPSDAELAKQSGATLVEIGNDHRLATPEALAAMLRACVR